MTTKLKEKKMPAESTLVEGRGVVYVKHVPHGFYETQMMEYFQQFGKVTRLRLSRSNKSGRSKGYAFVEFASEDVAKIAAKSMEDYLMFRQRLMCKYVEQTDLHPATFKDADRKFRQPRASNIARDRHNRPQNKEKQVAGALRLRRRSKMRLAELAGLGIEYSIPALPNTKKISRSIEELAARKSRSTVLPATKKGPDSEQPAGEKGPSAELPAAKKSPSTKRPAAKKSRSAEQPATKKSRSTEVPAAEESQIIEQPAKEKGSSTKQPAAMKSRTIKQPAVEKGSSTKQPATKKSRSTDKSSVVNGLSIEQPATKKRRKGDKK